MANYIAILQQTLLPALVQGATEDQLRARFLDAYQRTRSQVLLSSGNAIAQSLQQARQELQRIDLDVDPNRVALIGRALQLKRNQTFERADRALMRSFTRAFRDTVLIQQQENLSENDKIRRILDAVVPTPYQRVKGAALIRGISRVDRTERQRIAHDTLYDMYQEAGVSYVYWRLSSSHKDYGGAEVCEVFAASTGNRAELSSRVLRTGLYEMSEVPEVPHPNCGCSIEPAN
jgi:hypothetical protein